MTSPSQTLPVWQRFFVYLFLGVFYVACTVVSIAVFVTVVSLVFLQHLPHLGTIPF